MSQGNGNGLRACKDLTEVMMEILQDKTKGFELTSPSGADVLKNYGPRFMDDVNLLSTFIHKSN